MCAGATEACPYWVYESAPGVAGHPCLIFLLLYGFRGWSAIETVHSSSVSLGFFKPIIFFPILQTCTEYTQFEGKHKTKCDEVFCPLRVTPHTLGSLKVCGCSFPRHNTSASGPGSGPAAPFAEWLLSRRAQRKGLCVLSCCWLQPVGRREWQALPGDTLGDLVLESACLLPSLDQTRPVLPVTTRWMAHAPTHQSVRWESALL